MHVILIRRKEHSVSGLKGCISGSNGNLSDQNKTKSLEQLQRGSSFMLQQCTCAVLQSLVIVKDFLVCICTYQTKYHQTAGKLLQIIHLESHITESIITHWKLIFSKKKKKNLASIGRSVIRLSCRIIICSILRS